MQERRLIKKYANRRLYDTVGSRYVSADDVRRLITEGEDVQIIDDTTGDDITRGLLLQIISDQERGDNPLLGYDFLTQVIRYYGHPMQDMMARYLSSSMESFAAQQQMMQKTLHEMMQTTTINQAFDTMTHTNLAAWKQMQELMMSGGVPPSSKDERDAG